MNHRPLLNRIFFSALVIITRVTVSYAQETTIPDSIHIKPIKFDLLSPYSTSPDVVGYDISNFSSTPIIKAPPVMPQFKPEYYPDFYTSKSPLHKGDYAVSGVLRNYRHGFLYGSGRQDNVPGVGTMNFANIGYQHFFNDRLSMSVGVDARQSNIPNFRAQSFGTSGVFSYQLNDWMTLNTFGAYNIMPASSFRTYDYGGSVNVRMSERFGTEVGVRRHYNSAYGKWETIPIVIPYYKFSEKFTLGADVGGLLKYLLQDAVKVGRGADYTSPTIRPPIP